MIYELKTTVERGLHPTLSDVLNFLYQVVESAQGEDDDDHDDRYQGSRWLLLLRAH